MRKIAKLLTLVMPNGIEVQAHNSRLLCLNVRDLENNRSHCYICKKKCL